MVLVTFFIVVARKFFDWGSIAVQESVVYMHAAVFLLGAAYTLKHAGHVRVDLIYRDLSARGKAWVDIFGMLLFAIPFCAFLTWVSWDYVSTSWSLKETSREAGGLPYVYLMKALIPASAALLAVQCLAELMRAVSDLKASSE